MARKESRRKFLAAQSFPEKIHDLVKMQEMVAPIARAKGRVIRVWKLD